MIRAARRLRWRLLATAASACVLPAGVAVAASNVTPATIDVFNLLSPFLSLGATPTGQATLASNLSQAIAVNNGASPTLQALGISDENLLGGYSNTLADYPGGVKTTYGTVGVAANLGGTIPNGPPVNGIVPSQPAGGLGTVLGAIYETGINASTVQGVGPLKNTAALLTSAYGFTSSSLGPAKNYFANGTYNGTVAAVAPAGLTLPTYNGLPNTTNSVYDTAYGVSNTQSGQQPEGDSRPYQVATSGLNLYDPSLNQASSPNNLLTNPSFPSGHTNYAFTESYLLAMLVPQEYQSMLDRGAQYANSRIVLGAHYPLDIIASRSFSAEQLAQAFTNPAYVNNATTTGTAINLPNLFTAAQSELTGYLAASCGATVTACATSPANANSLSPSAANAATYAAELNYGLPTLSYAQAPREQAPAGGPDASILLATVYGGSTSAAQTLAPNGGLDGSLQTSTINQIVVNTEGQAFSAFYGSSLSYWSRINLYAASGYFSDVVGVLNMASTDVVTVPVTVASTGVLVANGSITGATTVLSGGALAGVGAINGAVTIQSGGVLAPGGVNASGAPSTPGTLTVSGPLMLNSGSTYAVQVGSTASLAKVSGAAAISGASVSAGFTLGATVSRQYTILTAAGGLSGTFAGVTNTGLSGGLTDTLTYDGANAYLALSLSAAAAGATNQNQTRVVDGLNNAFAANGSISTTYATLSGNNLSLADGEVGAASHQVIADISGGFVKSFFNGGLSDPSAPGGHEGSEIAMFYADPQTQTLPTRKGGALQAIPTPFAPYWTVWSQAFGGGEHIGGSSAVGSNDLHEAAAAGLVGIEYRLARDTAVGFGFGGGAAGFNVSNGLGSGTYAFGQLGGYVTQEFGKSVYVSAAVAGGFGTLKTSRTDPTGAALSSSSNPGDIVGRVELGDKFDSPFGEIAPYGAFQIADVSLPAYTETGSAFALNYAAQTVNVPLTELGFRLSRSFAQPDGSVVTFGGQAAWAHDFKPTQFANVSLAAVPGSQFSVTSASPAADTALLSAGAKIAFAKGFAIEGRVESQIGGNVVAVGGRGSLSYSW